MIQRDSATSALLERMELVVQRTLADSGRNTPRTLLYHEVAQAIAEAEAADVLVCCSIAARHVVDKIVKKRSDIQLPTLKQIEMFGGEHALRAALSPIVHESGDGAVTPFRAMLIEDFDDQVMRDKENLRRVADRLAAKSTVVQQIRPFMVEGMGSEDAFVMLWHELREHTVVTT
jgi:hypothetical protein